MHHQLSNAVLFSMPPSQTPAAALRLSPSQCSLQVIVTSSIALSSLYWCSPGTFNQLRCELILCECRENNLDRDHSFRKNGRDQESLEKRKDTKNFIVSGWTARNSAIAWIIACLANLRRSKRNLKLGSKCRFLTVWRRTAFSRVVYESLQEKQLVCKSFILSKGWSKSAYRILNPDVLWMITHLRTELEMQLIPRVITKLTTRRRSSAGPIHWQLLSVSCD